MMKWLAAFLLFAGVTLANAEGLNIGAPSVQSTNAIETCGPSTPVTLSAVGQFASLPFSTCPGITNYLITLTTPGGQSALVGTLVSADDTTGGSRRPIQTGAGNLENSTRVLSGTQPALEWRTIGGGYGQRITLTAYTSGAVTVQILGLYGTTALYVNGAVDNRQDVAARQGRLYTASTGIQTIAAGQNLSLQFAVGASATYQADIIKRVLDCSTTNGVLTTGSASNPTVNLATNTANVTNRGITGGLTSQSAVLWSNGANHPDVAAPPANPTGSFIKPGAPPSDLDRDYERLVAPGQSFSNWITNPSALGTTYTCYITYLWLEEPIQ